MDVTIYKGVIKELGDGVVRGGQVTTYSFIEMDDGRMIKMLHSFMGIDKKLRDAYRNGDQVELYVFPTLTKGEFSLMAIQIGDGKLFGSAAFKDNPYIWVRYPVLLACAIGLCVIIVGFFMFYPTWKDFKRERHGKFAYDYLHQLPNVIII